MHLADFYLCRAVAEYKVAVCLGSFICVSQCIISGNELIRVAVVVNIGIPDSFCDTALQFHLRIVFILRKNNGITVLFIVEGYRFEFFDGIVVFILQIVVDDIPVFEGIAVCKAVNQNGGIADVILHLLCRRQGFIIRNGRGGAEPVGDYSVCGKRRHTQCQSCGKGDTCCFLFGFHNDSLPFCICGIECLVDVPFDCLYINGKRTANIPVLWIDI